MDIYPLIEDTNFNNKLLSNPEFKFYKYVKVHIKFYLQLPCKNYLCNSGLLFHIEFQCFLLTFFLQLP